MPRPTSAPEPRAHTPRSDRPTRGPGLVTIARAKGREPMPWQRDLADVALEVDPATGLPWYRIVVVTVPRQSGKTTAIGDVADHRCLTNRSARVWYTAQTGKDASAWMRDEHFPSLQRAAVFGRPGTSSCRYTLSKRAGQEGVTWRHGATFKVFPPMRDALHGRQTDMAVIDEAWALGAEQGADVRQAIRPTMATRPGSQLWVVSTMGDAASAFFDGYVDLGRAALGDPRARVALVDYGLRDDDDPEDLELVAARHPAYGHTIDLDSLRAARDDFGADIAGWTRAYGNRPTRTREAAIPAHVWASAGAARLPVPDRAGIALDVTPDGTRAAIAASWRVEAGDWYVELVYSGPVTRELPGLLARTARARSAPVTVDRSSIAALEVLDELAVIAPDVAHDRLAAPDAAAAAGAFERGIRDGTGHHFDDPDLDAAVEVATKRPVGDGAFTWSRKGSAGSICELVAASTAAKAFDRLPAPRRAPVASTGRRP